jgi:hypothetical protein
MFIFLLCGDETGALCMFTHVKRRMSLLQLIAATLATSLFVPGLGQAATYNEAVNGDLHLTSATTGSLIHFDLGTNTVTGSTYYTSSTDNDQFMFVIPTGGQLTSVSYAFFNVNLLAGTTSLTAQTIIRPGGFFGTPLTGFAAPDVAQDTSPVALFVGDLPISAGTYWYDQGGFSKNGGAGGGSWSYTLTFEIGSASTVPLPAALPLLGTGLGAIGLFGWMRRRRAIASSV